MCDTCRPILGRYTRAHPKTPCPVAKSLYCGACAVYGHSPARCRFRSRANALPNPGATETPYPVESVPANWYEVANEEGCIKAALVANGGTPMICQEKGKRELREYGENKRRLMVLVREQGGVLILRGEGPQKKGAPNKKG